MKRLLDGLVDIDTAANADLSEAGEDSMPRDATGNAGGNSSVTVWGSTRNKEDG